MFMTKLAITANDFKLSTATMKILFIINLSICILACNSKVSSTGITEQDQKQIIDREIKTWEYSKTKELDKLKEILADDYVGYFGRKIMNENDVIQSLQKATVYSYQVKDIKVKPLSESVAIVYYTADQKGVSEDGTLWVPKVAAAATYVKRNGIWYSIFYQETVLDN